MIYSRNEIDAFHNYKELSKVLYDYQDSLNAIKSLKRVVLVDGLFCVDVDNSIHSGNDMRDIGAILGKEKMSVLVEQFKDGILKELIKLKEEQESVLNEYKIVKSNN